MRDAMTLKKHYPSRLHTHIVDVYELMNETYQCGMKQQNYLVFYFYRYRIDDDMYDVDFDMKDESEAPLVIVALDRTSVGRSPPP